MGNLVQDYAFSNSKAQSYIAEVIANSPPMDHAVSLPVFPQLRGAPRVLPLRVAAMFRVLVRHFNIGTLCDYFFAF